LQRMLHEPCPSGLLPQVSERERHQHAGQEHREEQSPILRERLQRYHTKERDGAQQRGEEEPKQRDEVLMDSNPPSQDSAQQILHADHAARCRHHQEGRQSKGEDREDRPSGWYGRAIGTTPNPLSERSRGIMPLHPNAIAMKRKAATGWRATRRLSGEWIAESQCSVRTSGAPFQWLLAPCCWSHEHSMAYGVPPP
jgi:hypothetical protein